MFCGKRSLGFRRQLCARICVAVSYTARHLAGGKDVLHSRKDKLRMCTQLMVTTLLVLVLAHAER